MSRAERIGRWIGEALAVVVIATVVGVLLSGVLLAVLAILR